MTTTRFGLPPAGASALAGTVLVGASRSTSRPSPLSGVVLGSLLVMRNRTSVDGRAAGARTVVAPISTV
jgi:uncharacterized membrane protein (UPF0136 family)